MARIWSDRQLERATPTQAKDLRGKAFLSAVNRLLGDRPLPGPHMRDPEICPAEVLPALVAEYSMEEFIEPGLPEHVVRRILKNRWALQTGEGYDAGVKLGLSLLGMTTTIEQWWQVEPKRPANTHRLYFFVGEALFPDELSVLNQRTTKAALRMIDATKRWSQDGELFVGAKLTLPTTRTAMRATGISCRRTRMRVIQQTPRVRVQTKALPPGEHSASVTVKRVLLGQEAPVARLRLKSAATAAPMPATARKITLKGGK